MAEYTIKKLTDYLKTKLWVKSLYNKIWKEKFPRIRGVGLW